MTGKLATDHWTTRPLTKADYDYIVSVIDRWWGGPTSTLAHPILFYELGRLARVVEHQGKPVAFLLGFVTPGGLVGYVHLVGIANEYRRRGLAHELYRSFEADCVAAGCRSLKAITTLGNEGSVRFHLAEGWKCEQVADYAGTGRARLVFTKPLRSRAARAERGRGSTRSAKPAARIKARRKAEPATARPKRGTPKRTRRA